MVLEFDEKNNNLVLIDTQSKKYVNLTDDSKFIDYLLIKNDTTYTIVILKSEMVVYYGTYPINEIGDDQEYLDSIRGGLKEVVVPDVSELGTIEFNNDSYKYPLLRTVIKKYMYFDKEGNLYMNK